MKKSKLVLALLVLGLAPVASAQSGAGFRLWLGVEGGYAHSDAVDDERESTKNGYQFAGKGAFSLYSRNIIFDFGLGWAMNELTGKAKASDPSDDFQDRDNVKTKYGFGEVAIRMPLLEKYELGPVAQVSFGTDSTFTPDESGTKRANVFAGLQLYRPTTYAEDLNTRWGVQFLTDLSINERQIYLLTLQYHIGVPIITGERVRTEVVEKHEKQFLIDAGFIYFETGKDQINTDTSDFLRDLSGLLKKHDQDWSQIRISGHTDTRGSAERNRELSEKRAEAVRQLFIKHGVPSEKVTARAVGAEERVIAEETKDIDMARNRRVEVEVIGAVNAVTLKSEISRIRQAYNNPSTCGVKGCK